VKLSSSLLNHHIRK